MPKIPCCPFCGESPRILLSIVSERMTTNIKCINPSCKIKPVVIMFSHEEALKKWSRLND